MNLSFYANSLEAQLNELELPNIDELNLSEDQIEILLTLKSDGGK
jgi:hypothetical protein